MNKKNFNPSREINFKNKTRLVVYDDDSKEFIKKDIIDKFQSLNIIFSEKYDIRNLKYKYQYINEGRWEDLTKYQRISEKRPDENRLVSNFSFSNLDKKNIVYLKDLNERQTNYYAKNVLRKYYFFLLPLPDLTKVNRIKSYIDAMPMDLVRSSNNMAHFYTLVVLMTDYIEKTLNTNIDTTSKQIFLDWQAETITKYKFDDEELVGFITGSSVARGNIASIHDRNTTYEYYQQALKLGKGFIEDFLGVDPISTYYPKINGINVTYEIIDKHNQDIINSTPNSKLPINICFSTDMNYFRMFATNWANANFHFNNLVFNFGIVTNSEDDYYHCVSSYHSIVKSIAKLLRVDLPNNFRFFWIKSTVINKTVYACARFYLASYLINNYDEDIYISDIDQLVIGDFEKYLENFNDHKFDVYQPISSGYTSMLPGRSHLAGNIFIRNSMEGKKYCEILTNYVGMGLNEEYSWILDQNATRYASEIIEIGNLNTYGKRALKQYPSLKTKLRSLK